MSIKVVNLKEKFDKFSDYWAPHIVGELNGQHVKIAKFKDSFTMHKHEHEDEFFMVIKGQIKIELEDSTLVVNEGEFAVIPKGILHRPHSDQEAWVMLFEPTSTINTGNIENDLTKDQPTWI